VECLLLRSEARPGDAPVTATPPRPAALDLADVARTAAASASEADEDSASWEPHSGCTAVAAVVWGQRVIVANAGDSRCVVCDSNGKAIPLSFDHKPEDEREQARIYAAGAVVEMGRVSSRHTSSALNLTRAIGDLDLCASIPANYDESASSLTHALSLLLTPLLTLLCYCVTHPQQKESGQGTQGAGNYRLARHQNSGAE
jgi:hypothetical protein